MIEVLAGSHYFAWKVFILLKAKFLTWIIYFTFKEWTSQQQYFVHNFVFYFLAFTPTLPCAKKVIIVTFITQKRLLKCSV